MKPTSALVIIDSLGPDTICLKFEGLSSLTPKTFPNEPPMFTTTCMAGYGEQWVKENLGIEPEILIRRQVPQVPWIYQNGEKVPRNSISDNGKPIR